MAKETFRVGKLSDALDAANVPLSAVVKANGFVFVSGQPPLDATTGELVKGDIRTQTEYVMENLKLCLETAGSEISKGAARSPTLASPVASRARIARRVGSPSAEKTASSSCEIYLTIWLNITPGFKTVKHFVCTLETAAPALYGDGYGARGTMRRGRVAGRNQGAGGRIRAP